MKEAMSRKRTKYLDTFFDFRFEGTSCVSRTRWTIGMSAPGILYTVISPVRYDSEGGLVRKRRSPRENAGSMDSLIQAQSDINVVHRTR